MTLAVRSALLLHGLGSAGRAFDRFAAACAFPCDAPDLPGFGGAAPFAQPSLGAYADWAGERLARLDGPTLLLGWSMGGKLALALAARRPERLAAVVLLAPSPPGGEPMEAAQRARFVADGPTRENAEANVRENAASPPPPTMRDAAVADWLRSDPETFRWWFREGSQAAIDVSAVDAPALILGGAEDARLGAEAQARLTAPQLARAQVQALPGVGHLIPLEAPRPAAERVAAWLAAR